ncbi:hypothetical protein, partial [Frankia sp. AgKG'84/4]
MSPSIERQFSLGSELSQDNGVITLCRLNSCGRSTANENDEVRGRGGVEIARSRGVGVPLDARVVVVVVVG